MLMDLWIYMDLWIRITGFIYTATNESKVLNWGGDWRTTKTKGLSNQLFATSQQLVRPQLSECI